MKKSLYSRLASDSAVYGLTGYLNALAALILTPVYTKLLSKADFGTMDVLNSWNILVLSVLPLALPSALQRWYPDLKDNPEKVRLLISTLVLTMLFMGIAYALFMWISASFYFDSFFNGKPQGYIYGLAVFILIIQLQNGIHLSLLRSKFEKWKYLAATCSGFVILAVLGFWLVYFKGKGVEGFFEASLVSVLWVWVYCNFVNWHNISIRFSYPLLKELLSFSINLLSVNLLFNVVDIIDRYLIVQFLDLDHVGIYSIAMRFGSAFNIFLGAFAFAWMPLVLSWSVDDLMKKKVAAVARMFVYLATAAISVICIFRMELFNILAPGYEEAYNTVAAILFLKFIGGIATIMIIGLHVTKQTKSMPITAFVSMLINLATSVLLIRVFGILGVVMGSIAGALFYIIYQHRISQVMLRVPHTYRDFLIAGFIFILTLGSVFIFDFLIDVRPVFLALIKIILSLSIIVYALSRLKNNKIALS